MISFTATHTHILRVSPLSPLSNQTSMLSLTSISLPYLSLCFAPIICSKHTLFPDHRDIIFMINFICHHTHRLAHWFPYRSKENCLIRAENEQLKYHIFLFFIFNSCLMCVFLINSCQKRTTFRFPIKAKSYSVSHSLTQTWVSANIYANFDLKLDYWLLSALD